MMPGVPVIGCTTRDQLVLRVAWWATTDVYVAQLERPGTGAVGRVPRALHQAVAFTAEEAVRRVTRSLEVADEVDAEIAR
jgi:hypothetical protein